MSGHRNGQWWRKTRVRVAAAVVLVLASAAPSRADDYVDRVNAIYSGISKEKRSDLVLLPLLMKMDPAPAELKDIEFAMLVTTSHPAWGTLEAWATAEPQKAVLAALKQVTDEEDFRTAMVFGQGYGVEAVSDQPELLSGEMYTELGDPPTLAAAKHGYLPALQTMEMLANIEATRQQAGGDPTGAIGTLFNMLYFARQVADRAFVVEKSLGFDGIGRSLTRMRDVAYIDSRGNKKLSDSQIKAWVKRLDLDKGYINLDRIRIPDGTIIAAEQLVQRVMEKGSGPKEGEFSAVMARIATGERPLRLLSETAAWEQIRQSGHEGYWETMDVLVGKGGDGGLRADWARRWDLSPFDPFLRRPSDFESRVGKTRRLAVLGTTLKGVDDLFDKRMAARAELTGTRVGMSIYGYQIQSRGSWPRDITSIRPTFMERVDFDPYSSSHQERPQYFVPVRDRPPQGARGEEIPFEMNVYPGGSHKNFSLKLRADSFVLYSVGPNDRDEYCKDATQGDTEATEGDYLMWPPVLSLTRKYLEDVGQQP